MTTYSARDLKRIYKWTGRNPYPSAVFNTVDLSNLRKRIPEPVRTSDTVVLLVHGRASKPKQLQRYFGGLAAGLESTEYDTRCFTWPSRRGLVNYGEARQGQKGPGFGTARQRSYQAYLPLERVVSHLRTDTGYKNVVLVGHSLGGNVVNRVGRSIVTSVKLAVLLSPDILLTDWNERNITGLAEQTYLFYLPSDKSLAYAALGTKDQRVGVSTVPDHPTLTQFNVERVTDQRPFGHDTYPVASDLLGKVRTMIEAAIA